MRWDIWNYPLRALTIKKLTVAFLFLSIGLTFYSALTYLAYYVSALDVKSVWDLHHLFPVPIWAKSFPTFMSERGGRFILRNDWSHFTLWSKLIWIGGVLFLLWTYFTAGLGISKLEIENQRGDPFYPLTSSIKEAIKRSGLFWTATSLLIGVGLVVFLVHALLSFWGRLNILFYLSVALIIATFGILVVLSLLFIYMLIGWMFVLIYGPAVSVAMEGDTFDLYYEGFSIFNEKLHKFLLYEIWIYSLKVLAFSIFTFLLFKAVRLSATLLHLLLPRFKFVYSPALSHFTLPQLPYALSYWLAFILPMDVYAPTHTPVPTPTTYSFSVVFDVWMLVFLLASLSYWVSLTWTGRLFTYARIMQEKDEIDIFSIKPASNIRDGSEEVR